MFTHASWSERRSDSYTRLAFLGDSVLGLAMTAHLYPLLEAERYGAGRLTKIRAQTVSGPACRQVAERIQEATRFREDLEADSLDLYTLVQELEDSYGVHMTDQEAAEIVTVRQAVDFVVARGVAE